MDLESLADVLREFPLLVVCPAQGRVFASQRTDAFADERGHPITGPIVVCDVEAELRRFAKALGDRLGLPLSEALFILPQVSQLAGTSYFTVRRWLRAGILRASVASNEGAGRGKESEFNAYDGFVAAVLGSIRRITTDLAVLRKTANFLYRAPAKLGPAARELARLRAQGAEPVEAKR